MLSSSLKRPLGEDEGRKECRREEVREEWTSNLEEHGEDVVE